MAMRFHGFERDLQLFAGGLTGPELARELAAFARAERDRLIREGQASPVYDTFVNGRPDVPEESVELPGPIIYQFSYLEEAVIYALAFLEARAPVLSGRYRRSFFVLVDGKEWAEGAPIPPTATVLVTNDQPYSRKIQVGSKGFRLYKGLFDEARQAVNRQFRNLVWAEVAFVPLHGGYVLRRGRQKVNRAGRNVGQDLTYPAVRIRLRH